MADEVVVDGFRLAAVFDRVDPVTGPAFASDSERLSAGDDREAVAAYLREGVAVLITPLLADDVLDPSRTGLVPLSYRTDGSWIWTDTVTYYLEQHGLIADAELLAHVRAQADGPPPVPGPEVLERAAAFILTPPEPGDEAVWNVGGE